MDIAIFSPSELDAVVRMLRGVAAANGVFTASERDFVEGVAQLHGASVDADTLAPIAPEDAARVLSDPQRRKRAIQLAIVTALVEGEPAPEVEREVNAFARALDLPEEGLRVLHEVARGHSLLARFDMGRRMRRFATNLDTFPGFFKIGLTAAGMGTDEHVAARYHALAACPVGSFGRAFHDHFVEHHFPLPGEKYGVPEGMLFHDIGHVLSGYGVDPQGEIQQAAFQAGFVRRDGFLFLLFGVLQFHAGIRLTPVAKAERGYFDTAKVLRALGRGAKCKVDFSENFDMWDHVETPLAELRRRFGIEPIA